MSKAQRTGMRGALSDRVERVFREVRTLRRRVEALESARHLELTDERGRARIVVRAGPDHASVELLSWSDDRVTHSVELFAIDRSAGVPAHAGVALCREGDLVAAFELVGGHRPRLWVDDELAGDEP